jgi:hypothetical protein
MKWLCLGIGAVTLVIVAALSATGHRGVFMPGPLSEPHRKLDCRQCHRPWSLTRSGTTGCVSENCHLAVRQQRIHLKGPMPSCSRCHVEHAGARYAARRRPATIVGDAACRECHLPKLKKDHPAGVGCEKCHFHHVAPRGCAPSSARSTAIPMKHYVHLSTMAEILKVKDRETLCLSCHQARPDGYGFAPFTRQGCNRNNDNCHAIKRPEGQKKFKDPLEEKPIKDFAKAKPPNALFMHSRHLVKSKCGDCHPDAEKSKRVTHAPLATVELCARCHKGPTGQK